MKLKSLIAAGVIAAIAPLVHAIGPELIVNGGFESSTFTGPYTTFLAGSTALTGWTIGGDSVDLINTYWSPASGSYSLDLSGNNDGTISQSFATTIGQKYQVSFSMAGNPDDTDKLKTVQVGLYDQGFYTFDASGKSHTNMGWLNKSFQFTATDTSSTLFFTGTQESPYGVALDNISVSAVPEPEMLAMMLAGLGVIGAVARRRRTDLSKK